MEHSVKFVVIVVLWAILMIFWYGIFNAETYRLPDGYQQCVKNCQRSYAGNPGAIRACISRCR